MYDKLHPHAIALMYSLHKTSQIIQYVKCTPTYVSTHSEYVYLHECMRSYIRTYVQYNTFKYRTLVVH